VVVRLGQQKDGEDDGPTRLIKPAEASLVIFLMTRKLFHEKPTGAIQISYDTEVAYKFLEINSSRVNGFARISYSESMETTFLCTFVTSNKNTTPNTDMRVGKAVSSRCPFQYFFSKSLPPSLMYPEMVPASGKAEKI
jgi:hypothetical protein